MSAFPVKRCTRIIYLCLYIAFTVLIVSALHFMIQPRRREPKLIEILHESAYSEEEEDATKPDELESFQARISKVDELCRHYHLGKYSFPNRTNALQLQESPTPQYSYFFLNRKFNFAWCPVYKAGSTSWLHNMMILAGHDEQMISKPPKQLSIWAREVYGEPEPDDVFVKSKKLLIVRHPFERLISAYRDKLSNSSENFIHGTAHFYEKYGRKIVAKFRPSDSPLTQKEPTFSEFVDYLISTDVVYYDDHWLPVYFSCTPCLVRYDFVAKVETYNADQERVIKQMNFDGHGAKPKWKHKTATAAGGGSSTNSMSANTLSYLTSHLTEEQIAALYDKYKLDFELFGYTM